MKAPKVILNVSVRDLVEFALRAGDLGGERRFVGSDRILAGIRGHQKIQRSRPPGYQSEVSVEETIETEEFTLRIRGRIDGLLATARETLIEEIKTVQGVWDRKADPLHWAQAKCYAFIHAKNNGGQMVTVQLTYLELETGKVSELRQGFSFDELTIFFETATKIYVEWLRGIHEWIIARNQSIAALNFPFPEYRPGQRELAIAVYRTSTNGGRLFAAAPTGIGKTISTLFPAIKALGEGKLERLFYLTARTVGRAVAEKALADLRKAGLKFRAVTLTAKEKVCVRDGHPCEALTCPFTRGYYDRVRPAIQEALDREGITRAAIEAVAIKHQVCPFELALDVSVWADVVICDYNYVFDPTVYLKRHFDEEGGDYGFLIDEAHNLVDRAREMYSADLNSGEVLAMRKAIKSGAPRCAKALLKLNSGMRQLAEGIADPKEPVEPSDPSVELNLFPTASSPSSDIAETAVSAGHELPKSFIELLETALGETEAWLVRNESADFREELLELYFRMFAFRRTADLFDDRFISIIENTSTVSVRLFCLDPSKLLQQALKRGKASIFFSATLTPIEHFRELLGGESNDPVLQLASPFPPQHLGVFIHDRIQTHFKARADSLREVVEAIGVLVQGRAGNYLVYFPSYQYLNDALQLFREDYPALRVLIQKPGMTESERDAFLEAFSVEHNKTLVGFAVLGGIFGEGIDLVGERLIGAVIVGVGLPQLSVERDLIRDYFQKENAAGFDYAYTFPGMNRVLQAVGRVIRSSTDRGVVLLIDARFVETRYRRLYPTWWQYVRVRNVDRLRSAVKDFWERTA